MADDLIRAAGGVVHRDGRRGVEVLLVHRPGYDDWTFPKGKLGRGEKARDAALREVHEETGFTCELGAKLRSVRYDDRKGRAKRVRYWLMTVVDGSFRPNDEVDAVEWVPVDQVAATLTYPHDAALAIQVAKTLQPA